MRENPRLWSAAVAALVLAVVSLGAGPETGPGEAGWETDRTFRATVIVRREDGQGSGTVIASKPGETLVLTAAHVVRGAGPVTIEAHRYNMGLERTRPPGGWPVALVGEVAARDDAGDVAVVRVKGRSAMPFVARFVLPDDEPEPGALVVSLGIDGGAKLESWSTRVRDVARFSMAPNAARPTAHPAPGRAREHPNEATIETAADDADNRTFLLTEKAPVPGRSGGGLFLADGRLVGVCVGRIERPKAKGPAHGLFASPDSVRQLLRRNHLETAVNAGTAAAPTPRRSSPTP